MKTPMVSKHAPPITEAGYVKEKLNWKSKVMEHFKNWHKKKHRYAFLTRYKEVLNLLLKYCNHNETIVDVGCGDGEMLNLILNHLTAHGVGIDLVKDLIKVARTSAKKMRIVNVDYIVGDAEHQPFRERAFNKAYSAATIEHLPAPFRALKELWRILKTDGLLIITTPNPRFQALFRIASKLRLKYDEGPENLIELDDLCKAGKKIGFKVLEANRFLLLPFQAPIVSKLEDTLKAANVNLSKASFLINQVVVFRKKDKGRRRTLWRTEDLR